MHQITNYKQYPNSNDQKSKRFEFDLLEFEIYLLFGICYLGFTCMLII
jgi:hypothetical protein